ncbi:hypothetical protein ACIQLG_17030 [Terribacillus saccharophilus]|uniref:hypothetical protein n=1 Tax=Terribacillus saccharophilus TaxID=361277 RepID=UPI0038188C12
MSSIIRIKRPHFVILESHKKRSNKAKPINTEQGYVALEKEAIELLDGYVSKRG